MVHASTIAPWHLPDSQAVLGGAQFMAGHIPVSAFSYGQPKPACRKGSALLRVTGFLNLPLSTAVYEPRGKLPWAEGHCLGLGFCVPV
jgi:hypothetical protein